MIFFKMDKSPKARLKELLLQLSYEKRDVVLASGEKSQFYIDCKQTSLNPEGAVLLGGIFCDMLGQLSVPVAAVGGPTLGADPLVSAVSVISFQRGQALPAFIIRTQPKDHGTAQWVEGMKNLKPGMKVAILEDVVTSGGSSLKAVERARQAGLDVVAVLCIVDRGHGGADKIRAAGLEFRSIFTLSELVAA